MDYFKLIRTFTWKVFKKNQILQCLDNTSNFCIIVSYTVIRGLEASNFLKTNYYEKLFFHNVSYRSVVKIYQVLLSNRNLFLIGYHTVYNLFWWTVSHRNICRIRISISPFRKILYSSFLDGNLHKKLNTNALNKLHYITRIRQFSHKSP